MIQVVLSGENWSGQFWRLYKMDSKNFSCRQPWNLSKCIPVAYYQIRLLIFSLFMRAAAGCVPSIGHSRKANIVVLSTTVGLVDCHPRGRGCPRIHVLFSLAYNC